MDQQIFKGELSRCLNEKEIEWKISRFISLSEEEEAVFESSEFDFMGSKYQLVIKAWDENDLDDSDDLDDVSHRLFLKRIDKNRLSCQKIEVTYTYKWNRIESSIDTNYKLEKSFDWDFQTISIELYKFDRIKLLQQTSADKECTLTVLCRMKSSDLKREPETVTPMTFEDLKTLSGDLKKLLKSGMDSDVTLRVQGKDFRAHRSILASRCNVLAADFKRKNSDSSSSAVNMTGCDSDAFGIFLEYLYSGYTGELSVGKALHLLEIAVKYSTCELRSFCVEFLRRHLAVVNVCEVASAARLYGEFELLSDVQVFFSMNTAEIFCTESWEKLLKDDCRFANELLKGTADSK